MIHALDHHAGGASDAFDDYTACQLSSLLHRSYHMLCIFFMYLSFDGVDHSLLDVDCTYCMPPILYMTTIRSVLSDLNPIHDLIITIQCTFTAFALQRQIDHDQAHCECG
jgi:hypothetical protein